MEKGKIFQEWNGMCYILIRFWFNLRRVFSPFFLPHIFLPKNSSLINFLLENDQ